MASGEKVRFFRPKRSYAMFFEEMRYTPVFDINLKRFVM